jgi:hypothetical protein
MNTNIRAEKSKKIVNPPGPGVRALCAAFLMFPVVLATFLVVQSQHFDTLWTRFDTLKHDKSFSSRNLPPQKMHAEPATSPAIASNAK